MKEKKTIVVGMSGGVDSAVCAYLLKKEGHNVIGLFMRNWDSDLNFEVNNLNEDQICPQEQDYNDALNVCKVLNIPLHRVDFVKEYWDFVFTTFLKEIKKGRTPNPDILCNKYIKFDLFKKEAFKLGADLIATGHYARNINNKLYRGIDLRKDQSYFLSGITNEQLNNVIFPLGDYTKEQVRNIANRISLPVSNKKDSTGICFIGNRNFSQFLKNYLKVNKGNIIDINSKKILATHQGVNFYTIGQRKDLGISGEQNKYYVCGKNIDKNILYVTDNKDDLLSDSAIIEEFNLISPKLPAFCTAKFRYQSKEVDVFIEILENNKLKVIYPNKFSSVTPGQTCVLYLGEECIGGGVIDKVYLDNKDIWYLNG